MPHTSTMTRGAVANSGRIRWTAGFAGIALASVLGAATTSANEPCRAFTPEVASDLAASPLPSSSGRWRAIENLWAVEARSIEDDIENMLKSQSLSPAADLLQGRTQDLLREAIEAGHDELADAILGPWMKPFSTLSRRSEILVYYQTPHERLSPAKLDGEHELWVGSDGIENVLYTAIYLAGASDIIGAIARRPPEKRTAAMTVFAERAAPVALDHYLRWIFGPPRIWQVQGWGCQASGLDLIQFVDQRLTHSVDGAGPAYCSAPTSVDLLLAIGLADLLKAADVSPDLVSISKADYARLGLALDRLSTFIESRFVYDHTTDMNGQTIEIAAFDPGAWTAHPDMAFAADESPDFPTSTVQPRPGVGWDFSHGARIAWTLDTFLRTSNGRNIAPWDRALTALAHQVAYRVLDDTAAVPRFRNYLDGSNGWYHVTLQGPDSGGIPPFGASRAFLSMPWAALAARDARLEKAVSTMWHAIAAPTSAQCAVLHQAYEVDSYRSHSSSLAASPSRSLRNFDLFPFLSISPTR